MPTPAHDDDKLRFTYIQMMKQVAVICAAAVFAVSQQAGKLSGQNAIPLDTLHVEVNSRASPTVGTRHSVPKAMDVRNQGFDP